MGSLSDVVSYLFGLALNLLDAAINGFLGALGFDLDTFEHYFPAAADYHEVIVGFAVSLLFIMLVFQLFRNFGVVLDMEAEDPLKILGKTALFLGMIVYSRSVVNLLLQLMADPYAIFLDVAPAPYEFKLLTLATAMFDSVFSNPFIHIAAAGAAAAGGAGAAAGTAVGGPAGTVLGVSRTCCCRARQACYQGDHSGCGFSDDDFLFHPQYVF